MIPSQVQEQGARGEKLWGLIQNCKICLGSDPNHFITKFVRLLGCICLDEDVEEIYISIYDCSNWKAEMGCIVAVATEGSTDPTDSWEACKNPVVNKEPYCATHYHLVFRHEIRTETVTADWQEDFEESCSGT
ncbi:hypothetical protein M231_04281 [Tremella mesenterica]|uniref:Uncharacterized protein n=1 Tax=Tremella mesenterica TaxID=5217 RepID=A0A4Q1BL57_TREME|nr:hypothetical protein M231_04281 [Tremella mesenterica]